MSMETCKGTMLWNQQVLTDRTISDKLDVIICDNEKGTRMLIDVAISGDKKTMYLSSNIEACSQIIVTLEKQ
jgi:DNA-binding LacI/PurR family transcriptional regulator